MDQYTKEILSKATEMDMEFGSPKMHYSNTKGTTYQIESMGMEFMTGGMELCTKGIIQKM